MENKEELKKYKSPTARKLIDTELNTIEEMKVNFISRLMACNFRYTHCAHISKAMNIAIKELEEQEI